MNPEINNEDTVEAEKEIHPVFQITTVSKYFALALFILLPFIGGYVGYTYAPEKNVEVEKVVTEEGSESVNDWALPSDIPSDDTQNTFNNQVGDGPLFTISSSSLKADWDTYRSERYSFEMSFPSYFNVSENEYDQVSTIISFSSPDLTVLILPNGGADYGLEEVDFTSEEIEMGANTETKWIGKEEDFYREFVYVSSSTPASWTNLNRIEVRGEPNDLTNEILSTLNFLVANENLIEPMEKDVLTVSAREQGVFQMEEQALTYELYTTQNNYKTYFLAAVPNNGATCCDLVEFNAAENSFIRRDNLHSGSITLQTMTGGRSQTSHTGRFIASAVEDYSVFRVVDLENGEVIFEEEIEEGSLMSSPCGVYDFSTNIMFSQDDTAVTYGIYEKWIEGTQVCELNLIEMREFQINF